MSVRVRMAVLRVARATACALALWAGAAPSAHAQPRDPLPLFAVDAQGTLPKLPTDDVIAQLRGLDPSALPVWGPGFNLAAHVYPLRTKRISLGVGASYQWLRGTYTPDVPEDAASGFDPGPSVTTKSVSFSPVVSLNFGHRRGWITSLNR